ncbi:MAG: hypothetical protein Q7R57_00380, partial [Dehalococcoidales bacterium]|nr:hypothetical protein [Dehalococcoidales bacterium]
IGGAMYMWKGKKKFIVIGLTAVVVLAGSIIGVAYAQTGTGATSGNTTLDRVAAILKIDPQTLKTAFAQAQQEQRDAALDNYLNNLVQQGKIKQPDADAYKAWLKSKPNIQLPNGTRSFGMHGVQGRGGMMGGRGGMMGGYNFRGAPNPPKPSITPQ